MRSSNASLVALTCVVVVTACGDADSSRENRAPLQVATSHTEKLTLEKASHAHWSGVIPLPMVPAAGANLPDGRVLFWSAEDRFAFRVDLGQTYTVVFDPITGASSERLVSETQHDMFCPGTANLPDGRLLVNGGFSNAVTSIYDPATGAWTRAADMNIGRAYQGTTPLADGSVFTLGGSWPGGSGNRHGEIWTESSGWRLLSNVLIDPFLSVDTSRPFGGDSHLWLLPAGNGRVFHAGPGVAMHWIDTQGDGTVTSVGPRGDDEFSINGGAVMYDTGKILKAGGAPGYEGFPANSNSYVIRLGASVTVRRIQSMAYPRAFHNLVVLPNGQVVVIGGMTVAVAFSDDNSVLAPEIFDPSTETFVVLPPISVPRNYHSVALLLPDGRVLSAGGGLCGDGCGVNHPDVQILSPPYLFNADGTDATRPLILSAPQVAAHSSKIVVTTDSDVSSFSIVRASSATHSLNNDQRRLALGFRALGGHDYEVEVPGNPGWAVPGIYMLFAMNAAGVPSISSPLKVEVGAETEPPDPEPPVGSGGAAGNGGSGGSHAGSGGSANVGGSRGGSSGGPAIGGNGGVGGSGSAGGRDSAGDAGDVGDGGDVGSGGAGGDDTRGSAGATTTSNRDGADAGGRTGAPVTVGDAGASSSGADTGSQARSSDEDGCGCRVTMARSPRAHSLAALLLIPLLARRRRRYGASKMSRS